MNGRLLTFSKSSHAHLAHSAAAQTYHTTKAAKRAKSSIALNTLFNYISEQNIVGQ